MLGANRMKQAIPILDGPTMNQDLKSFTLEGVGSLPACIGSV